MKPVYFNGCNTEYGKSQPEYLSLPAHKTTDGIVTSCWQMNLKERLKVLFLGKIFLRLMTFNQPLQPQLISVDFNPLEEK